VTDFWREGGLNVLGAMVRYGHRLPPHIIPDLLEARRALAPAYTGAAVERSAGEVAVLLERHASLPDEAEAYAAFDWEVHHVLTVASGNPVYTLILNGFAGIYERVATLYFAQPEARAASHGYYQTLLEATRRGDAAAAERVTRAMMHRSIELWHRANADPNADPGGDPNPAPKAAPAADAGAAPEAALAADAGAAER
jgi:GntR family transcriptional regulator, negative regulator for fad regulon and positive regulator of fabA